MKIPLSPEDNASNEESEFAELEAKCRALEIELDQLGNILPTPEQAADFERRIDSLIPAFTHSVVVTDFFNKRQCRDEWIKRMLQAEPTLYRSHLAGTEMSTNALLDCLHAIENISKIVEKEPTIGTFLQALIRDKLAFALQNPEDVGRPAVERL